MTLRSSIAVKNGDALAKWSLWDMILSAGLMTGRSDLIKCVHDQRVPNLHCSYIKGLLT